jgi:hypothetical protein
VGYVSHPVITCKYCDFAELDSMALGGQLKTVVYTYKDTTKTDTTVEWMRERIKIVNDSIRIIEEQNEMLKSINYSFDTVKWTPYYYKPKKKHDKTNK